MSGSRFIQDLDRVRSWFLSFCFSSHLCVPAAGSESLAPESSSVFGVGTWLGWEHWDTFNHNLLCSKRIKEYTEIPALKFCKLLLCGVEWSQCGLTTLTAFLAWILIMVFLVVPLDSPSLLLYIHSGSLHKQNKINLINCRFFTWEKPAQPHKRSHSWGEKSPKCS